MTEFTMEIAGRVAAVAAMFESTRNYCEAYLVPGEPDFTVRMEPEDLRFEREKSARQNTLEGIPVRNYPDSYLEILGLQRKLTEALLVYDTLLFHGSVIAVDGVGYLFTAKSGTGKSTHTRLWREVFGARAVMVNDDKPFLRITGESVTACGSPWNGKHGLGSNISVPLKAICVLERGKENRICKIPAQEMVGILFQQSNRPRNPRMMARYMELIDRLAGQVEFYRLACNMDCEAAVVAYEAMSAERKDE